MGQDVLEVIQRLDRDAADREGTTPEIMSDGNVSLGLVTEGIDVSGCVVYVADGPFVRTGSLEGQCPMEG